MMLRLFIRSCLLWPLLWVATVSASLSDARISVLVDVLKLSEAAEILSVEGVAQAQELNDDMLDGQGGPGWVMQVGRIYDPARMVELVRAELAAELSGDALEEVINFFASSRGVEIITLENAARMAIQDKEVEDAARAKFVAVEGTDDTRLALINELIEDGDMIGRNVTSAINSNFQFFSGMADGDALEMTEEEMLNEATGDLEAATRDTTEWLFGYMMLAYSPLSEDDLRAYIAFGKTDAGRSLNRALFEGFGKAYEDVSYGLGQAVALNMTAQEL